MHVFKSHPHIRRISLRLHLTISLPNGMSPMLAASQNTCTCTCTVFMLYIAHKAYNVRLSKGLLLGLRLTKYTRHIAIGICFTILDKLCCDLQNFVSLKSSNNQELAQVKGPHPHTPTGGGKPPLGSKSLHVYLLTGLLWLSRQNYMYKINFAYKLMQRWFHAWPIDK